MTKEEVQAEIDRGGRELRALEKLCCGYDPVVDALFKQFHERLEAVVLDLGYEVRSGGGGK